MLQTHRAKLKEAAFGNYHNSLDPSVIKKRVPLVLDVVRSIGNAKKIYESSFSHGSLSKEFQETFDTVKSILSDGKIVFDEKVPITHSLFWTQVYFLQDNEKPVSLREVLEGSNSAVYAQFIEYYKDTWFGKISYLNKYLGALVE